MDPCPLFISFVQFSHLLERRLSLAKSEKRVVFRNQDADPTDERDWHNQHEWLVDMLEKLYAVFRPRLEKLMMRV